MNLMMENNVMRDIVERLELQAFVADKIQSGMKPLIMDCLEEITRLRADNETLRRDVKTAVMGDSAELQDVKRENEKLWEVLNTVCQSVISERGNIDCVVIEGAALRAAAAAIRETEAPSKHIG